MTTPDQVAWLPNMYTLKNDPQSPRQVDDSWTAYEQQLMESLDALATLNGDVDAKQWLRVLVPFVAGLFVRGPDFGPRHDARLPPLESPDQEDNANQARLVEQARVLAPVMAAVWAVFSYPGPTDLVASDRGYGFVWHGDYGRGFGIPINARQALILLPNRRRVIFHAVANRWRAPIDSWSTNDQAAHDLNRSIASHALNALVGPTPASVQRYTRYFEGKADLRTEPFNANWASSRVRRAHEWDWLRALHVIGGDPDDNEAVPNQLYDMDGERFDGGWMPRVLLALYNPDGMSRGLTRNGDQVGLQLMEESELPPRPPRPRLPSGATTKPKVKRARMTARASRRANRRK